MAVHQAPDAAPAAVGRVDVDDDEAALGSGAHTDVRLRPAPPPPASLGSGRWTAACRPRAMWGCFPGDAQSGMRHEHAPATT